MKKKNIKKEIIEWGVFLSIIAILFFTGWYKDVAATLQRVMLQTGLFKAEYYEEDERLKASYDFVLTDFNQNEVPFEKFRNKPVFINFWATWCPPCIAEMPDIQKLYDEFEGSDVSFVMISLDKDPEKAKKFIERKNYTFPVYFLSTSIPDVYESSTIPTTFILSPKGEIVMQRKGMADYYNKTMINFIRSL